MMTPLTSVDLAEAWARGREVSLKKGGEDGPGWPRPPHPVKPRAPRQKWPVEGARDETMSAPVYMFKPHRLKDLRLLHEEDNYEHPKQRSARPRSSQGTERVAVRRFLQGVSGMRPGMAPPGAQPNFTAF